MPRKVRLPGAEELFRSTADRPDGDRRPREGVSGSVVPRDGQPAARPSGRVRHDEKITIYLSEEELLGLEQARLALRARHAIVVDRGRLVREAIGLMLAGLEEGGEQAQIVQRLRAQDGLG